MKSNTDCAHLVAPEDIAPGDHLVVLDTIYELTPLLIGCESWSMPERPVRLTYMSRDVDPKKVVAVCLPLVLVEEQNGKHVTIDVRRNRVARVTTRFARIANQSADGKLSRKKRKKS